MPIDAYTGKPGHGKSYGVVQHVVIPSLKQNRHVVTNIPLKVDMLLEDFGGNITQLPDDWHTRPDLNDLAPPGCVLILDELWRRWPSGLKANNVSHEDKALLAEHRHRVDKNGKSMRIVLVTQDLSQVAAFAVALVEQTYRVVKKTKTHYRVDIYSGVAKGDRPPKSQLQRQAFGKFSKEVHRYYSSATQSLTGEVGDESKADRRGNPFASPAFWALFGMIVVSLVFGVWGVKRFFNPPQLDQHSASLVNPPPPGMDVEPAVSKPSIAQRTVETVYRSADSTPPGSASWRVAGWLGCTEPVGDGSSSIRPCGASTTGFGSISRTSTVVLVSAGQRRMIPMEACKWIEQGLYVLCDVDGERITPWTGRGAVTQVVDSVSSDDRRMQSAPRSERSDQRGTDASDVSSSNSSRSGSSFTIVEDNSRMPRTL